jgi:hypothetical protein
MIIPEVAKINMMYKEIFAYLQEAIRLKHPKTWAAKDFLLHMIMQKQFAKYGTTVCILAS